MDELQVALRTCGYRDGYKSARQFHAQYGVSVRDWPSLFSVRNGLVVRTRRARQLYDAHVARNRDNWRAIGCSST